MITTVIGARGFVGSHLVGRLQQLGIETFAPERGDPALFTANLGHVIYCAGITADFRNRPYEAVEAHVTLAAELLRRADFASFLYLSSTRVYFGCTDGRETADLLVNSQRSDDLFNLSKLLGESLCLAANRPNVRIARLSNVCGNDFASNNFLYAIIKDAVGKQEISLQTSLDSEKDYISINDVVTVLLKIAFSGKAGLYNVASGINLSNQDVAELIQSETGCGITVADSPKTIRFPPIDINRIQAEFAYVPSDPRDAIRQIIRDYQNQFKAK